MTYTIADTFKLLTQTVDTKPAIELINKCKQIGMDEKEYLDLGYDSNLPDFEKGYTFSFKTDNGEIARMEILEKQGQILQAGVQIIYKPALFFSNFKKHYKLIVEILDDYYGTGQPIALGNNAKGINYGDFETVCYISRIKANNINLLTLKMGNAKFWNI